MKPIFTVALAMTSTLVAGVLASELLSRTIEQANDKSIRHAVQAYTNQIAEEVLTRFNLYQYGLRATRAVVLTAGEQGITRDLFSRYSQSRDFETEFPGALGFGFIRAVPEQDEAPFLALARADGKADFSIRYLGPNNGTRYVIQYIEPQERNSQAVGLDIASEANRKAAADASRDTGTVQLTGPITLVQWSGLTQQSFLILMPIYRTIYAPATLEERREAFYGWSYAPLITQEILQNLSLNTHTSQLTLRDVTQASAMDYFFRSITDEEKLLTDYSQTLERTIFGRTWQIDVRVNTLFIKNLKLPSAKEYFYLGALISLLVSAVIGSFISHLEKRRKIQQTKSQLSSIVDNSIDAIIGLDPSGKVTSWNKGAERLFGFNPEEAIGEKVAQLIVPDSLQHEEMTILNQIAKGGFVDHFTTVRKRKDGSPVHVSIAASPLINANGIVVGSSKTARDITLQIEAENQIQSLNNNLKQEVNERTAQLTTAANIAELGVWTWEITSNRLDWNDRMYNIYDQPLTLREQGLNYHHWYERVHPEDADLFEQSLKAAVDGRSAYEPVFRIIQRTGAVRRILAGAQVERDEWGKAIRVTGINRDITEQYELEKQLTYAKEQSESANRAKSTFLANMSHEIRTPINGVTGMLHLIGKEALTEQQKRFLTMAENSAASLTVLINDILDFSKIEAGKLEIENRSFDLFNLMEETCSTLALSAYKKELEFVLDLADVKHIHVIGDDHRLRQILTNLVGNAIKFTERGSIIVYGKTSDLENNGIEFSCSVIDTGLGISREKQDNIFNSFSQEDSGITRKFGGTGLGLSIAKKIAQLMDGDITLDSDAGQGSKFTFTVSLISQGEADASVYTEPTEQAIEFLIADPEVATRVALEKVVLSFGHILYSDDTYKSNWIDDLAPEKLSIFFYNRHSIDSNENMRRIDAEKGIRCIEIIKDYQSPTHENHLYLKKPFTPRSVYQIISTVLGRKPIENERHTGYQPEVIEDELEALLKEHRSKKILLVDDNIINLEVGKGIIESYSLQVDLAHDGANAIEMLLACTNKNEHYALILMDCQMPILDGFEATKEIRKGAAGSDYCSIPIIAMTANAMVGYQESCLAMGMNDYLPKPIDPTTLAEKLLFWFNLAGNASKVKKPPKVKKSPTSITEANIGSAWDKKGAMNRVRNKVDRMHMLIDMFITGTPDRIAALKQNFLKKDFGGISAIAHELKGISGNIGGTHLFNISSALEIAAKNLDTDATNVQLNQIETEFLLLKEEMLAFKQESEPKA